ncbi:MAG: GNAT family N-acetyltransferase [Bacteroidetes bacterium]|nr:GNAT family N-acetyltransferase [Bacteroidia bacterium]PCH65183.1 MAG: GNAT family N-acetyltransferase [Bacteroidota bacterium]
MNIKEFNLQDKELLLDILLNNEWEFHSASKLTKKEIEHRIQSGYYTKDESKTFLIFNNKNQAIGFFRLFDLGKDKSDSETPLFDIRIRKEGRNEGIGKQAVNWLTNYIFSNYPNKNRIEATTRHDNIAMRKVLQQCGYLKEAHYRQSWPTQNKTKADTIGYGILRHDWENNTLTPVNWNE